MGGWECLQDLSSSNIHGKFQTGESCAGEEGQHGSPAEPRFFGLLVLVDRTDLGSRKAGKASIRAGKISQYDSKKTVKRCESHQEK